MNAHCRISVPPSGPPTLALAVGFDVASLANPAAGEYHLSLLPSLAFTAGLCLQVSGTKPGVICNAEALSTTEIIVYRERSGSPENGDVWVSVVGIGAA